MADRYGDDMEFKKMLEETTPQTLDSNCIKSTSTKEVICSNSSSTVKRVAKASVGSNSREFDKGNWEYWEKNVPNAFNPYDGRSVPAIGQQGNHKDNRKLDKKSSSSG